MKCNNTKFMCNNLQCDITAQTTCTEPVLKLKTEQTPCGIGECNTIK